jgi:hypothetical protein
MSIGPNGKNLVFFVSQPRSGVDSVIGVSASALFQFQVLPMDLNRVPSRSTTIRFVVLYISRHFPNATSLT